MAKPYTHCLRALQAQAQELGWRVVSTRQTNKGHFVVTLAPQDSDEPQALVTISGTASDWRAEKNIRADVRRAIREQSC